MSLRSLCTGDEVFLVTLSGGAWGEAATPSTGSAVDCRIDTFSASEDRRAGKSDQQRSGQAYFLTDPGLAVGKLLKWTRTGTAAQTPTVFSPVRYLRVTGFLSEGRPGGKPLYFIADWVETTAEVASEAAS